jgi:hypothetical protein
MDITIAAPLFPSTHPLGCLPQEDAETINDAMDLAHDGIVGWAHPISRAQAITEDLVFQGDLTQDQADAVIEYTRSF